jgi:diguanylate cyclase (GGDEF)-like protein
MRTATERLEAAIAALPPGGAPFAVLRIGMDGFRVVNETLGHAIGDDVLELAEQRLQAAVREHEIVVRLPGDEFAVLLHSVESVLRAGAAADRLNDLVQRVYLVQGEVVNVTACLGIALAPEDGTRAELLLQRAGAALQCAKASGIGMVQFFEPAMEENRKKRHSLSLDLRKALLLRQFEVHYQPQVDVRTGALTGFEALLRWRHPDLGLVSPAEFIPLAEEIGLMGMIGEWVLRTACEQAAQLPEGLVMAINASPVQFKNGYFAQSVETALERAGIAGRRIEIEITEGLLLKNEAVVITALNQLHRMNVRLAMDDFGTGYSSLGQLAKLPFDKIKIDRSLVGGSAKERAIVRAITTLGEGIGIATLAEGIETRKQLVCAEADGCSEAQGFFFSKAVPSADLPQVLKRFAPAESAAVNLQEHVATGAYR